MSRRAPGPADRRLLPVKLALFFGAALLWLVGATLEMPMVVWTAVLLLVAAVLLRRFSSPGTNDRGD